MENFPDKLRILRKNKGLNQSQLADKIGIARTTVSNYEQGVRFPKQNTLIKIAEFFEVSVDYLLGNEKDEEAKIILNVLNLEDKICFEEINNIFLDYLLKDKFLSAYKLIRTLTLKDIFIADIFEKIIKSTFLDLNRLWLQDKINEVQMIYISRFVELLLNKSTSHNFRDEDYVFKAVTACVSGEFHSLGLQMFNLLLNEMGGKIYYLGENAGNKLINDAIKNFKPDFAALSATLTYNKDILKSAIKAIRSDYPHLPILLGGGLLSERSCFFAGNNNLWVIKDLREVESVLKNKIF